MKCGQGPRELSVSWKAVQSGKAVILESGRLGVAALFCCLKPWRPSTNYLSKPSLSKIICERGITKSALWIVMRFQGTAYNKT